MITEEEALGDLKASNSAYRLDSANFPIGYAFEQAFSDTTTGFIAVVFRNPLSNERIVAFTGTQLNFQGLFGSSAGMDTMGKWKAIDYPFPR